MVLSNETKEFVLSIVDYNQDYNTKLILLCVIVAYSLFFLWYPRFIGDDMKWKVFVKLLMKITGFIFIFFTPLFTIFLVRGYPFISLWTFIATLYGALFAILSVLVWVWGYDAILMFVGIKHQTNKRLIRRKK